jgi:hypothetical protein
MAASKPKRVVCPECEAGKHNHCAGYSFNEKDEAVDCPCVEGPCRDV